MKFATKVTPRGTAWKDPRTGRVWFEATPPAKRVSESKRTPAPSPAVIVAEAALRVAGDVAGANRLRAAAGPGVVWLAESALGDAARLAARFRTPPPRPAPTPAPLDPADLADLVAAAVGRAVESATPRSTVKETVLERDESGEIVGIVTRER